MRLRSHAATAFVSVAAVLAGCAHAPAPQPTAVPAPAPPNAEYAGTLRDRVTADAMMAHLKKLQEIADAHDGTRAMGTPGYQASVDYVANTLRDKGFDVQTPEFEVRLPFAEDPALSEESAKWFTYGGFKGGTGYGGHFRAVQGFRYLGEAPCA